MPVLRQTPLAAEPPLLASAASCFAGRACHAKLRRVWLCCRALGAAGVSWAVHMIQLCYAWTTVGHASALACQQGPSSMALPPPSRTCLPKLRTCVPFTANRWQLPWQQYTPWQIVGAVTRGSRLPLPSPAELPGPHRLPPQQYEAYTALLVSCWAQNPADRPSFGPIIESLRWVASQ